MTDLLTDRIRKAQYGEIHIVGGGEIGHFTVPSHGIRNTIKAWYHIVESDWLERFASIIPAVRKKAAGKGVATWRDCGDQIILVSMITPPRSYLTVYYGLISELEEIAKIKGYETLGINTQLPRRIMETAGWTYVGRQWTYPPHRSYIRKVNN